MHHHHLYYDGTSKRVTKIYPPTTIAPSPLPQFDHLKKSIINKTILKANEAVFLLFK
jgi:hypothetical protein